MPTPEWPFVTGQASAFLIQGLSGEPVLPVEHTPMGTGPSNSRQTDDIVYTNWTGMLMLTKEETETLDTWLRDTVSFGAVPFLWKDPRTRTEKTFKIMSVSNYVPQTATTWMVSISVQEIP